MATAGPAAFVAEARALTFGSKDLAAASDGELLRLGKVVCEGLGIEGLGFGRVVERLVQSEAYPTATEARAFVRSAVGNLAQGMPAPAADVVVQARSRRDRLLGGGTGTSGGDQVEGSQVSPAAKSRSGNT